MSLKVGQTIRLDDFCFTVVAGEALSARDAVYISSSDNKAYKCDADDLAKIGFVGFVVEAVSLGADVTIQHTGQMTGFSGLTIGVPYYLSGTAGAITATAPTNFKFVAMSVTASIVMITKELTKRTRVYTSSDTWTKPGGLVYIETEVVGGGGGSGGTTNSDTTTGGGGAGGYAKKRILASALSATETVTIGAAGTAGTGSTGSNGGDGGTSSFGAHCSANGGGGGGGGSGSASSGGTGGTATGGDINIQGESGSSGFNIASLDVGFGGKGGSSMYGFGGKIIATTGSTQGEEPGAWYGSGASGCVQNNSSNDVDGRAGKAGIVIVTEYY